MKNEHDFNGNKPAGGFWHRVADLYVDGFRSMTVGRTLWLLIIIKLIFIFGIMKLFFFPNLLSRDYDTDGERADAVRHALITTDNKTP
ncbi:MAG: DUF4492 domain-containing protein [Muribaculaceae bacterium]|nr:DUF4492 domain-containing protein [Muribaculaceae bacterium]